MMHISSSCNNNNNNSNSSDHHQHAIVLNNAGVQQLQRQSYCEALETLKRACQLMQPLLSNIEAAAACSMTTTMDHGNESTGESYLHLSSCDTTTTAPPPPPPPPPQQQQPNKSVLLALQVVTIQEDTATTTTAAVVTDTRKNVRSDLQTLLKDAPSTAVGFPVRIEESIAAAAASAADQAVFIRHAAIMSHNLSIASLCCSKLVATTTTTTGQQQQMIQDALYLSQVSVYVLMQQQTNMKLLQWFCLMIAALQSFTHVLQEAQKTQGLAQVNALLLQIRSDARAIQEQEQCKNNSSSSSSSSTLQVVA